MTPDLLPMEKAERFGFDALSISELIAIILRVGQPGFPILEMTAELMSRNENKLKVLERRTREELMMIPGIGRVKAFQIEAVLEIMRRYNMEKLGDRFKVTKSADIFRFMQPKAGKLTCENIWVIALNRKNDILDCRIVSQGGTAATVFDMKAILRHILLVPAIESVIMVHNHPSGSLRPSTQDDNITRLFKGGCEAVGLKVLDHVIVTQDGYYSYADNGRL